MKKVKLISSMVFVIIANFPFLSIANPIKSNMNNIGTVGGIIFKVVNHYGSVITLDNPTPAQNIDRTISANDMTLLRPNEVLITKHSRHFRGGNRTPLI